MAIQNHKLLSANWVPTRHKFGKIKPSLIVVHESGTRITKGSCVNYCKRNKRKVAYHIVIERDGTVVQMAEFNKKTYHAGTSKWKGRKWCNSFSIGIALVGPTELKGDENSAESFYGRTFTKEDGIEKAGSKYHGSNHVWLKHTPEQLAALDEVVRELREEYPGIDIAGHYHVSPGRKIDPSPLVKIDDIGSTLIEEPEVEKLPDPFLGEHEVAHAKDTQKMRKTSRKMSFISNGKKFLAGVVPIGFFSWETFDNVKELVTNNAHIILLIVGVVAYLTFKYFEKRIEEDYTEGRYIPSEYEAKENA